IRVNPKWAWYFPLVVNNPAQSGGTSQNYPANMTPEMAFRYFCKPWPTKDNSKAADPALAMHDELAQASPIFLRGCSQFVVEFAGDYMNQPNTGPWKLGEDGQLDYEIVPKDPANPGLGTMARIRWYGLDRRYYDPGTV